MKKFLCIECYSLFDTPKAVVERHGLDTAPFEEYLACPECGGLFTTTTRCDICGEYITGEYAQLNNDMLVCENCYRISDIVDDM